MHVRELAVPDAYEFTPVQHADDRGVFLESYRVEPLIEIRGAAPLWKQTNTSVSACGVFRGIHYALVPPSQAKYVTVPRGRAIDYIVDLRVGSPTYLGWDSVLLDDVDRRAVFLSEGLGHAIFALDDDTVVTYLVTEVFDPEREKTVDAFDPRVGLELPDSIAASRSPRDDAAPSIDEAERDGLLPTWDECRAFAAALRGGTR